MPPVTVLKSLPAARITGALSPVIALSLIDADAFDDLAVAGDEVALLDAARCRPCAARSTASASRAAPRCGFASFFAIVSLRALFSDAACALLRPSAIASAKLANSSVTHSHSVTARMKPAGASPLPASAWIHRIVVRMLPM